MGRVTAAGPFPPNSSVLNPFGTKSIPEHKETPVLQRKELAPPRHGRPPHASPVK